MHIKYCFIEYNKSLVLMYIFRNFIRLEFSSLKINDYVYLFFMIDCIRQAEKGFVFFSEFLNMEKIRCCIFLRLILKYLSSKSITHFMKYKK